MNWFTRKNTSKTIANEKLEVGNILLNFYFELRRYSVSSSNIRRIFLIISKVIQRCERGIYFCKGTHFQNKITKRVQCVIDNITNRVKKIDEIKKTINETIASPKNTSKELDSLYNVLFSLRQDIGISEKLKKNCSEWFPRIIDTTELTEKDRTNMFIIYKKCYMVDAFVKNNPSMSNLSDSDIKNEFLKYINQSLSQSVTSDDQSLSQSVTSDDQSANTKKSRKVTMATDNNETHYVNPLHYPTPFEPKKINRGGTKTKKRRRTIANIRHRNRFKSSKMRHIIYTSTN